MKLSDPFGRMERRHQAGYETMRDALKGSGIDTEEKACQLIRQTKSRMIRFLAGVFIVLFLIFVFLPDMLPIALGLTVFLAVWAITSAVNGSRYIQRYIEEDLGRSEQLSA